MKTFRSVVPASCLFISIAAISCSSHEDKQHPGNRKPNILLINVDDLGWKDLGFMGSKYYETPNIDRLSSQGMIFTNAYSAAANCAPSRASLFSGMYSPRTGIYTVGSSERGDRERRQLIPVENTLFLADSVLTIAEVLQQNGYKTCHIGKWHIGDDPCTQGFDVNAGGAGYGHPYSYFSPYHNKALKDGPAGEYLTDRLTSEAIAFLKTLDGDVPFFMNFATYAVHTPLQPKPSLKQKYLARQGSNGQENAKYAAMIEALDTNVGRLLDFLHQSGKFENTLIVFASDNGGVYNITKQWPLRAGKGSYYEGGIRIPFFVVWPGKIKAGLISTQPVSNIDLYPTFLEAAGIKPPKGKILDGISLFPAFRGEQLADRPIFWHFPVYLEGGNAETGDIWFRTRPGTVIRYEDWKLHEYFEDGHLELYNLGAEPNEKKNLDSTYPEKTRELHLMMREWRAKTKAPVPTELNPAYKKEQ